MKTLSPFLLIVLVFALSSCKKKGEELTLPVVEPEVVAAAPAAEPKGAEEKYVYAISKERDPFLPLVSGSAGAGQTGATSAQGGMPGFSDRKDDMISLELKGIMKDSRKGSVAMLTTTEGEVYYLKGGRVYNRRDQMLDGISGIIKEDRVILISQNKTKKELTLRKGPAAKLGADAAQTTKTTQAAQAASAPSGAGPTLGR